ncbi:MAG: cytochrome c biogenesis heme-transporting ATPase CcmA [Pseudomonadales bacterium]|nr:cytochrome c biogenesis heme-transporting ATPase CcmA [Pseudomonadales bacterium]
MAGAGQGSPVAPLLRLDGLGCQRDERWLFRDLTLDLNPGELLQLEGPNGSGKSTLLRVLLGLYPDFTGTLSVAECLYLGHRPGVSAVLTAAENLRWYAALQGVPADVAGALERVGMAGYENVVCQHMSAGQQRRIALARLALGGAPLWLLDEPLTALDTAGQDLVRALVAEHLAAGGAVVCATHQPLGIATARRMVLGAGARAVPAGAEP